MPQCSASHHYITLSQPSKWKYNSIAVARYMHYIFIVVIYSYVTKIICPLLSASGPAAPQYTVVPRWEYQATALCIEAYICHCI